MKLILAATTMSLLLATGALAADPLEGMWRTANDDNGNSGLIKVAPCGDALCGTLMQSFDNAGNEFKSPNQGRQIISETKSTGKGAYRGKVYSPDRGKTYKSKLTLNGNTLKVSGCVFGICRDGGTWTRSN